MKFSKIKKYRKRHRLLGALLMRNPVLVMGLDLPFVIAAAVSLRGAVAMSIQMFLIHMITMTVGIATCRKLPMWLRVIVNVMVSTLVMIGGRVLIVGLFHGVSSTLGMYLYLMAVNSMTVFQSITISKRAKLWPVISGAFLNALGFSLVVIVVGLLREIFGNGTLWGVPVGIPVKMSGLLIPFSGFIIVGFLLAFTRFVNKKLLAYSVAETARREARYGRIEITSVETIDE